MKLYQALANGLLRSHPADAARVLDSLPEAELQAVLATAPAEVVAQTVRRMTPHRAASALAVLPNDLAGPIVTSLDLDLAANLLRAMETGPREDLLDSLRGAPAQALRSLLLYPEGTAGALMDPRVLALPGDLSAAEALEHMRASPDRVRYNLYVVDREQVLQGVLNLRELMLADRKALLSSIAHRRVHSLRADADRHAILTNPAWHDARSIPVVNERGIYLGAVRYGTLRTLEEEQREAAHAGPSTSGALGELFATGLVSVFAALASSTDRPKVGGGDHE